MVSRDQALSSLICVAVAIGYTLAFFRPALAPLRLWLVAVPVLIAFSAMVDVDVWIGWTMAATPTPKLIEDLQVPSEASPPNALLPWFLRSSKKIRVPMKVLLIIAVVVLILLHSTLISIWLTRVDNLHLPSLGTIRTQGLEAYWDTDLEKKTEHIDWGTLWLGSSTNATIYVRSICNMPTTLRLTRENLTFYNANEEAVKPTWSYQQRTINVSEYVNLTWNYNGSLVDPGESIQVILTLSAGYSIDFVTYLIENEIKRFSTEIHIRAIE